MTPTKPSLLQLVEMVGKRGAGDIEFGLDVSDDQAVGMGGEEQLHDAKAGFGAHGGEHVGEAGDVLRSI